MYTGMISITALLLYILDIDECLERTHNCSSVENRTCSNINGSFLCVCETGYHEDNSTEGCIGM